MARGSLLILGAGPTGLGLAACYDGPTHILEREKEVGGLCRSVEFGGAVFDLGGHSFHTPHPEVAELVANLMRGRWEGQRRDARVFFEGQLIDYPFQQHLDQIANRAIAQECIDALPLRPSTDGCETFEAWIEQRFGSGVARHFMLPYNRKLWARDLRTLGCDWVSERVAGADSKGAGPQRRPLEPDTMVSYPADGGFVEIFKALADRTGPIALGQRVVSIDPVRKTARTASGKTFAWDRLVSTIALPALLACLPDCPSALTDAAGRLDSVSLKVVMIATDKAPGERPQRIYIADPAVPAHKIGFNHQSSSTLRRRPREAVMCEVSYSRTKPSLDDDTLARTMIDWLSERGLIDDKAAEARIFDIPLAYPVPTADRAAIVADIRAYLFRHDIFSIGRFGGWNYANSDACLYEAMTLARRL